MSTGCTSYVNAEQVLVSAFSCPPEAGGEASAIYCCGFQDVKYCCDDPNSFFPYEHNYMWWLRERDENKLFMLKKDGWNRTSRIFSASQ